jgi:uncharacterized protein (TIGR02147 family)
MRTEIEIAADEVRPSLFLDYRLYLKALYDHMKRVAPKYSYLRFAEDLGFGASTVLHQIVRGYRPLTGKGAERVARALGVEGIERRYFVALVAFCTARTAPKREAAFESLLAVKREALPDDFDRDCLAYFSAWYHPVIWELIGTKGFRADPSWIAARIVPALTVAQVVESLALLLRLKLVEQSSDGRYTRTTSRISTGHRVKGLALVSYHQGMIDHGKAALTRISGKRRDISAVTLTVDEATAARLRSMIHAFQLQLLDEAERAGAGDQVYQVNIQLFPFTTSLAAKPDDGDEAKGEEKAS